MEYLAGILTGLVVLAVAVAAYWRHARKRRRPAGEVRYCENCGKRIKRGEKSWEWQGNRVCLPCRQRLGGMAKA